MTTETIEAPEKLQSEIAQLETEREAIERRRIETERELQAAETGIIEGDAKAAAKAGSLTATLRALGGKLSDVTGRLGDRMNVAAQMEQARISSENWARVAQEVQEYSKAQTEAREAFETAVHDLRDSLRELLAASEVLRLSHKASREAAKVAFPDVPTSIMGDADRAAHGAFIAALRNRLPEVENALVENLYNPHSANDAKTLLSQQMPVTGDVPEIRARVRDLALWATQAPGVLDR